MTNISRRLRLPVALATLLVLFAVTPASGLSRAQFPVQGSGDRGTDVVALQHLLRARGLGVSVSGLFGSDTKSAVVSFQQSVGLSGSGVATVSTWQRLVPSLTLGAHGDGVLALQRELNAKRGAGLSLTATFDSATRGAVRSFQQHMRLSVTGAVDEATWRHLIWHFERPDFARASLCNYNGGHSNADWGTASAMALLASAADLFRARAAGVVAIGDISYEHGGEIDLHATHEDGLDIDIALIRLDGRQCNNPGISYRSSQYDRADTRAMLRAFHDALGGHLQLIYFNDPQMIKEGLSIKYPNHDDHIHVRVCEAAHARARYVC